MNNLEAIIGYDKLADQFPMVTENYSYHLQAGTKPLMIGCFPHDNGHAPAMFTVYDKGHTLILKSSDEVSKSEISEMRQELTDFLKKDTNDHDAGVEKARVHLMEHLENN